MERVLKQTLANGCFSNVTPERSRMMAAVRGKHNKSTELRLKMALVRSGTRGFQLHPRGLPGKPDFFFPKMRLAVFVDGCFWHGCKSCGHVPKSNTSFWAAKLNRTMERDLRNQRSLEAMGITVLRFWEHELASELGSCTSAVRNHLTRQQKRRRTA